MGMSNQLAERTVIAAGMNRPDMFGEIRRVLTAEDFWFNANKATFEAMVALNDAGREPEPLSVYEQLQADKKWLADFGAADLFDLFTFPFVGAGVPFAIDHVKACATQRAQVKIAERMMQVSNGELDADDKADELAKLVIEMEIAVEEPASTKPVDGLSTWDEFLARPRPVNQFVIPNLLDRQEVVLVLGMPGSGKSWLSRQLAITVASGVHPFRPTMKIPPKRTLLIDLENPESTVQRQTLDPYNHISRLAGGGPGERGHIWTYPAGLNVRKRPDALLLERVVQETRPDLICIGSLYNVFDRGRDDWDTAAEETKAVFNRIRARYGCAFWIEHHMPRSKEGGASGNPFGSTIWERWPGYGRVIERIGGQFFAFSPKFRADREAGREFPLGLRRGDADIPWSPIWDQEELDLIKENFS